MGFEASLELWVTLKVEGQPVDFLVDTGAHHSVLKTPLGPLSDKQMWVQGATRTALQPWTTKQTERLGRKKATHSFIALLEGLILSWKETYWLR